jgi:hypothetical protein
MGKSGEERRPQFVGRARTSWYVGLIAYKTGNKTKNKG